MTTHEDDTLPDFEEDAIDPSSAQVAETKKGNYIGIHASGFRDFLMKAELQRAIVDCGFEHPSEVQHECIPQAILGILRLIFVFWLFLNLFGVRTISKSVQRLKIKIRSKNEMLMSKDDSSITNCINNNHRY